MVGSQFLNVNLLTDVFLVSKSISILLLLLLLLFTVVVINVLNKKTSNLRQIILSLIFVFVFVKHSLPTAGTTLEQFRHCFYRFWAHVIWAPKLKIGIHMCGRKM